MKIRMVGGCFQHQDNISIHNKESKNFKWIKSGDSDIDMYIDGAIASGLDGKSEGKMAWIFESENIFPVNGLMNNLDRLLSSYEMIFTHNEKLLPLSDKIKFVAANSFWIKEPKIYDKDRMVSMITSNKRMTPGHRERIYYAQKFQNDLDLYGRGFNEIETKEEGLVKYMFSVAIENGVYDTYFTEKVLDCFATGTIPIYLGTRNISNYFDVNGIIFLDDDFKIEDLNEELYYSKMDSIKNNYLKVLEYEILEDMVWFIINILL
jgi:glycosyl transferase family 10 (putative fucosyltransferase)